VNYAKLFEMNFFTCHIFLEVSKTQDLSSKFGKLLEISFFRGFLFLLAKREVTL
jgi:hypothetical protein